MFKTMAALYVAGWALTQQAPPPDSQPSDPAPSVVEPAAPAPGTAADPDGAKRIPAFWVILPDLD